MALVSRYPSATLRGLPAYEKHQRRVMKWAARLLEYNRVSSAAAPTVKSDEAVVQWEFEYQVRKPVRALGSLQAA